MTSPLHKSCWCNMVWKTMLFHNITIQNHSNRFYICLRLLYMVCVAIVAPLKNALDWASRGKNCWADKPAAIVSAGGGFGGGRSQYHLRQVGVFLDLHFINKPELCVQAFQQPPKFDDDGNLIDDQIRERLKQVLLSLQAFTLRLQKD